MAQLQEGIEVLARALGSRMMVRAMLGLGAAALMLAGGGSLHAGEPVRMAGGHCPDLAPHCPVGPPPTAKPGECFAKVVLPPRYETYTETVVISPARRDVRVVPPITEWVDQRVMVSPERVERHTIPATYRSVIETVVVRPASVRTEYSEAIYQSVTEKVMVRPPRAEWRREFVGPHGIIPIGARIQPTGEIMCLVEIPPEFRLVEKRVLVQPGRSWQVEVPAEMAQVTRQVIDRPAQVVERIIPQVWRTERVRRVIAPARTEYLDVPAITRQETRQRQVAAATEEWRRIDCPPPPHHPPHGPPPPLVGDVPGPPPARGERG